MDSTSLFSHKAWLEQDLWAAETFWAHCDDVSIRKLVGLLLVAALRCSLHLTVEVQSNVAKLLLSRNLCKLFNKDCPANMICRGLREMSGREVSWKFQGVLLSKKASNLLGMTGFTGIVSLSCKVIECRSNLTNKTGNTTLKGNIALTSWYIQQTLTSRTISRSAVVVNE